LRYLWPHWKALGIVVATTLAGVGLEVLRPWPTKILVDQVLGQQPLPESLAWVLLWLPGSGSVRGLLFWVCACTVLIFFAGTLMMMATLSASVRLGQRMVFDLGADLFAHLQRLSLLFHSRRAVGDTIARVTGDAYGLQTLVNSALLPLFQSGVTLVAMFAVMWHLEPTMTLMAMSVVPFLAVAIKVFGQPMQARSRARRDLESQMMSLVQQTLSALPAVQAFTREEIEQSRFRRYADDTVAAYRRSMAADMWFKLVVGMVTSVGAAVMMWLGATYALEGRMSVGTVLVFISYLASLYTPINSITYTASILRQTAANADRVLEILDTPADLRDGPDAREARLEGHVRYEAVTFGYEPGRPVLKGVSLEARPGEVVAIVGPTGAGKTTLVNLLIRFFDPSSGRVLIDGHDLRALRIRSLRQQVAMVLQEPFIFPLSAADNIAYGRPDASRAEIEAAAVAANAEGFVRRLPGGFDAVVGERGATLSGGEKQRLSIARALLKDAPILILDEPTSAVDARTEGLLLEALHRLMRGRTTFVIAHRLSTIRTADRILVLDGGEIVEQGRHAELMRRDGLYARFYRQQMDVEDGLQPLDARS
ncbi:MAG TPA: ABC transporter ATP-binding protein, partial [Vicinamibacterales bacterium]|nr:ABC transporter ATP-binding protein [Vicinamibacterales bacterium]